MDLVRDYEELEGVVEIVDEEDDGGEDEDADMRPPQASALGNADLLYEMEKRELKSTGFADTDRDILQKAFNAEFEANIEEQRALRRERRKRAAQQAGLQRRRISMEKSLQEEQDALAEYHQTAMIIELVGQNRVGTSLRMDIYSVCARALAKAMRANMTIVCVDLSSNSLNDHCGSYLARMFLRNNTVRKMELDNNNFGHLTVRAFGDALRVNTSLEYLSLDSNKLVQADSEPHTNALVHFTGAIEKNQTLVHLNLFRTGLDATAGRFLGRAVNENHNLLLCDIGHTAVEMGDQKVITTALSRNLHAFERAQRQGEEDGKTAAEKEAELKVIETAECKAKELKQWLDSERERRTAERRAAHDEKMDETLRQLEEQKKIEHEKLVAAKKAAAEAEEKKRKKAEKAAKKK